MDHNQAGGQKAAESIDFGDLIKAEGQTTTGWIQWREMPLENEKQSFEGEEFEYIAEVEKMNCI